MTRDSAIVHLTVVAALVGICGCGVTYNDDQLIPVGGAPGWTTRSARTAVFGAYRCANAEILVHPITLLQTAARIGLLIPMVPVPKGLPRAPHERAVQLTFTVYGNYEDISLEYDAINAYTRLERTRAIKLRRRLVFEDVDPSGRRFMSYTFYMDLPVSPTEEITLQFDGDKIGCHIPSLNFVRRHGRHFEMAPSR